MTRFLSWARTVGLAIGAGIVCFLAARLGLALLAEPNVVAALLAVSMSALVLTVLAAERRSSVAALKDINDKLQPAPDSAELGELLGALPAAVYMTDAAGRITYCNQSAVDLWGAEPKLGEDKWCDICQFYHADGRLMALEDRLPNRDRIEAGQGRAESRLEP
jgi:PAS domain-containing protein